MKYAFFIDIDGTLTDDRTVPQKNLDAISKARREGHKVFINTGRSLAFIPRFVLELTEHDGVVAGSGAYCRVGDEVILAAKFDPETLKKAGAFLIGRGRKFMFEGQEVILFHNRSIDRPGFFELTDVSELESKYKDVAVEKINISGLIDEEEYEFLSRLMNTVRHPDYAECAPVGCDKGKGLRLVMERIGQGFKSVAIGDSANDIDMIKAADISVAMGNSDQSLKDICDLVTLSNEEGGVGHIINTLTFVN